MHFILFLLSSLTIPTGNNAACNCTTLTLKADIESADLIFIGTPIAKVALVPDLAGPQDFRFTFTIEEVLKGVLDSTATTVSIVSTDMESQCATPMPLHQAQLVFGKASAILGEFSTNCTNNNLVLTPANRARLKAIKKGTNGTSAFEYNLTALFQFLFSLIVMVAIWSRMRK